MCGIAAIYGMNLISPEKEISQMLKRIAHRGNSLFETYRLDKAMLGANRLKIVDREKGAQPITNERNTVFVIFNGEIYNFLELKKILQQKNHIFRTTCDTEVLVHLYEEYGADLVDKLDGMFAFFLFDLEKDSYLIARDPFGIKPIYFAQKNNCIYFASEAKAFLDIGVKKIQELLPAHYMQNGKIIKYYEIKDNENTDEQHVIEEKLRELIKKSIKKRVQTDLPLGVLFGGGIDSSIVLMNSLEYHNDVTAFTIGFRNSEDVIVASRLSKEKKFDHLIYEPKREEILELIPKVVYQTESFEPNMIRGSILSYLLSRAVKEHEINVLLCGEGSDEIFAGYGDFLLYNEEKIKNEIRLFLNDLFRTQLQRVDRTSMAFTQEVRVPFLDKELVEYALSIPPKMKISKNPERLITTKYILRKAFEIEIPDYICYRDKITLMEGAGLGDVANAENILYDYANTKINEKDFKKYSEYCKRYELKDKEELYYFLIFLEYYDDKIESCRTRTKVAKKEIRKAYVQLEN